MWCLGVCCILALACGTASAHLPGAGYTGEVFILSKSATGCGFAVLLTAQRAESDIAQHSRDHGVCPCDRHGDDRNRIEDRRCQR